MRVTPPAASNGPQSPWKQKTARMVPAFREGSVSQRIEPRRLPGRGCQARAAHTIEPAIRTGVATNMSLGQDLAPHLPFLRRYARALTGSQNHGDAFVRATLEAIVAAPGDFPRDVDPRLGLYRTFHAIWSSANIEEDPGAVESEDPEAIAQARLARITPLSRQALLLTAMEGFTPEDAGYLIGATPDEVDPLGGAALHRSE